MRELLHSQEENNKSSAFLELKSQQRKSFLELIDNPTYQALPSQEKRIIEAFSKHQTFEELGDYFLNSDEFLKKLLQWSGMVGIINPPDPGVVHYLKSFFSNAAKKMTIPEFELMLEMNLLGEFGDPIQHFQMFNMGYLGNIMHKYDQRRTEAKKKLEAVVFAANKPIPVVPTKLETFMAKVKITYDYALAWAFEQPVPSYTLMFEFLQQIGLLETSEATMIAAKRAALEKMKSNRATTIDRQALKRIDEVMANAVETEKITLREAQKLIVIEHYRFYGQRAYDGQGKYIEILQQAAERYVKAHPAEFLETS